MQTGDSLLKCFLGKIRKIFQNVCWFFFTQSVKRLTDNFFQKKSQASNVFTKKEKKYLHINIV